MKIKMRFFAFFIIIQMFSCTGNSNSSCNDVSIRLTYSLVSHELEDIKRIYKDNGLLSDILNDKFNYLMELNNKLIKSMGGFKEGKNLQIVNPCNDISEELIDLNEVRKNYIMLVAELKDVHIINDNLFSNMIFIIDSYYCEKNCIYEVNGEQDYTTSDYLLNNLILQHVILDILYSQI